MSFKPHELTWNGKTYTIEPTNILRAIACVEDVITVPQMGVMVQSANAGDSSMVKASQIARAYAELLRFAGADVEDVDVYAGMFNKTDAAGDPVEALANLLLICTPPGPLQDEIAAAMPAKKKTPTKRRRSAGSRASTKR